jgi:hypothetical protein
MRHVLSFFAGVVAALLTWILLATGQHRWQVTVLGWDSTASFSTIGLLGPTVFLLIAAMMLGLVATTRISPMGPIAAGLMFTVPTILMFSNPFGVLNWASDSWRLLGQDFAPRLPMENGTLPFLGFMLLMATFSAKRWRRWPKPQPAPAPTPTYAPTPEAPAAAAATTAEPATEAIVPDTASQTTVLDEAASTDQTSAPDQAAASAPAAAPADESPTPAPEAALEPASEPAPEPATEPAPEPATEPAPAPETTTTAEQPPEQERPATS